MSCQHDPKQTRGPVGMYHCPECGDMVIAGMDHPDSELLDFMMEQLFKIELNLVIASVRRDGGPTEADVMEAFSTLLFGHKVPPVGALNLSGRLGGEGWACVSINGQATKR